MPFFRDAGCEGRWSGKLGWAQVRVAQCQGRWRQALCAICDPWRRYEQETNTKQGTEGRERGARLSGWPAASNGLELLVLVVHDEDGDAGAQADQPGEEAPHLELAVGQAVQLEVVGAVQVVLRLGVMVGNNDGSGDRGAPRHGRLQLPHRATLH